MHLCLCVCLFVCHITTPRARYEVVSISCLLQAALFYYHASLRLHKSVCLCLCVVAYLCVCACMGARLHCNILYPAPSLLILRQRFTTLHYICPVILFHPSHEDALAFTDSYMHTCVCVCVCVAAASKTCVSRVWRRQIHIKLDFFFPRM